jgi:preprotein translocase SecE subunit
MVHQRFVVLAFFLGAVFVAGVLDSALSSAFLEFSMEDTRLLGGAVNTSGVLAGVGGLVAFFGLIRSAKAVRFTDEVITELRKVTWPTRDEAFEASTTVIATAVFVAVLIGFYDFIWKNLANFFLFTKS